MLISLLKKIVKAVVCFFWLKNNKYNINLNNKGGALKKYRRCCEKIIYFKLFLFMVVTLN